MARFAADGWRFIASCAASRSVKVASILYLRARRRYLSDLEYLLA